MSQSKQGERRTICEFIIIALYKTKKNREVVLTVTNRGVLPVLGRNHYNTKMARVVNCALVFIFVILLLTDNFGCTLAKRSWSSSNRKTSSSGGSNTGHVTKPSYPTQGGSNSQSDLTKLSYSGYNSAPNRPATAGGSGATNSQPIGWNVPKSQGPPPAYSASNPAGGAHTNMHEAAPAYRPSNSAPPSYGSVSNVHTPITATNTHGVQSSYPGATYHSPGSLPPGATYYPAGGQIPPGATYHAPGSMPPGASYYPSAGHLPGGGSYYPSGGNMPAAATYVPAGGALPPGAVYYSQPPQQSSGLGFGSGLAAGAIGGALLGHVLTPTQTRVVESAPSGGAGNVGSNDDKIIIINNGPPGSVTTTNAGGATIITTGIAGENGTQPAANNADPAVPNVPLAPISASTNAATEQQAPAPAPAPNAAPAPEQPPPGGIVCMPLRVNETDPADNTKMIEVEKIACFPAPQPAPPVGAEINGTTPVEPTAPGENIAPLAPLNPVTAASQQLQASQTQTPLLPDNTMLHTSRANRQYFSKVNQLANTLVPLLVAYVVLL